ncbi:MAG: YndM family protein [Peptococcaceae bacterium]|nr:YndM family protein [Peptococcaceae bacterium]
MPDHIRALGIKTLALVIFAAVLTPMFTDLGVGQGIVIGAALSIIAYAAVDLLILPMSSNTAATASDIVVAALVYWAGVRVFNGADLSVWEILFFAVVVGVSEWFLHKYLAMYVLKDRGNAAV